MQKSLIYYSSGLVLGGFNLAAVLVLAYLCSRALSKVL
jgi:hypothetical protein